MTNGNSDDDIDIDDLVQEPVEGPSRFEELVDSGRTERGQYFVDVDLGDAKYLLSEAGSEVSARYHHENGGEAMPELGIKGAPNYESASLGPGAAALVLETAVSYPNELEMERRRMDFTHLAEDHFEFGRDLVTDRGPEGSDTDIGLTVEGEEDTRYKLEVPLESVTHVMQEDGGSEPQQERYLVMEGQL
jgi:hypothetical protein